MAEDDQEVGDDEDAGPEASAKPRSPVRLVVIFGVLAVVGLAALAGWLGTLTYQSRQAIEQRNLFLPDLKLITQSKSRFSRASVPTGAPQPGRSQVADARAHSVSRVVCRGRVSRWTCASSNPP